MRTNERGVAWAYQDAVIGKTVQVKIAVETIIGKVTHRYEANCGSIVRTNLEITRPNGAVRSFAIWSGDEYRCIVTVLNQPVRDARGRFIKRVETHAESVNS